MHFLGRRTHFARAIIVQVGLRNFLAKRKKIRKRRRKRTRKRGRRRKRKSVFGCEGKNERKIREIMEGEEFEHRDIQANTKR